MWFRILVLALGTFALGTDGFVIAGILPGVAHDVHVSVAMAGLAVTVFSLTYAIGSPVLAALTGGIARRRLLLISLTIFTIANVLAAVATNFGILLIARILAACGAALYTPTASAVAAALAPPEKRGQSLSLVTAGMTVSIVLGVPIGILVSARFNWQMTFVLIAVLSAIAFIGILAIFPNVANPPMVRLSQRLALLKRSALVISLCYIIVGIAGSFAVYTYLGPLLQNVTHLDETSISGMFLLFGLMSILGNIIGGYGADHWGTVRTLTIGISGLALALFILPFVAALPFGVALAIGLWGISGWMVMPPQQHRLISMVPESAGVVLSLNSSAIYLGSGSGAAIGGLLLQSMPVSTLGWFGGIVEVMALGFVCLSVWLVNRERVRSSKVSVCEREARVCVGAGIEQGEGSALS